MVLEKGEKKDEQMRDIVCALFCVAGVAVFVRPMLDLHSTEYTTLWVSRAVNRLPLITLTALRYLLIVFIIFFPFQALLEFSGIWLLPLMLLVIFLVERSAWLSSAYISAEARFMANFNERRLQRGDEGTEWLDEKLFVQTLEIGAAQAGKSLRQLDWGNIFSVNVVQIQRGRRRLFMPSGNTELRAGDRLLLVGRSEDLRSLRRRIGAVTQNGSLFQGDIFSNIVISAPQLTLDEAWEAAELAGIADDIRAMPMGMQTIISEGQGGISGGQKQRLMIARAVAPKPKILMFDEATSALDNKTQRQVSEALDRLKCTRIVIAHRLSTIKNCDRILVLDKGQILEDGTYDELIERNGFFAELVARQRLDNTQEGK